MDVENVLRLGRDGGDEVFRAATGCLDVLGAYFEHLFKTRGDVGEGALEGDDDLVMSERV